MGYRDRNVSHGPPPNTGVKQLSLLPALRGLGGACLAWSFDLVKQDERENRFDPDFFNIVALKASSRVIHIASCINDIQNKKKASNEAARFFNISSAATRADCISRSKFAVSEIWKPIVFDFVSEHREHRNPIYVSPCCFQSLFARCSL